MTQAELHTLTGPYVLDALPDDERAAFEQHLAGCDGCSTEVAGFREVTSKLSAEVAVPPSASLKADVMSAISQVEQLPAQEAEVVALSPQRQFNRRSALALAAAALAVAASGGIAIDQYRDNTATREASDQLTALLAEPDARTLRGAVSGGGRATIVASNRKDAAAVVLDGLPDLPSRQTYQLWLIDTANAAHSIGLAAGDPAGPQTKLVSGGVAGKAAFGLTVEPEGGSTKPTMPAAVIIPMA